MWEATHLWGNGYRWTKQYTDKRIQRHPLHVIETRNFLSRCKSLGVKEIMVTHEEIGTGMAKRQCQWMRSLARYPEFTLSPFREVTAAGAHWIDERLRFVHLLESVRVWKGGNYHSYFAFTLWETSIWVSAECDQLLPFQFPMLERWLEFTSMYIFLPVFVLSPGYIHRNRAGSKVYTL